MKLYLKPILLLPAFLIACSDGETGVTYICDGTEEVTTLENGQATGTISQHHRMWVSIKNRMFGDKECVIFNSSEIKCQSKSVNTSDSGEPDYWIDINRTTGLVTEKYEKPTERSFFTGKCSIYRDGGLR